MSLVYPHSATLWRKGAESSRKASWARADVPECRFERACGAMRSASGDASQDGALVIVPGGSLSVSAHDRIAPGASSADAPTGDALEVVAVEAVRLGARVDHIEVTAR